MCTLKYACTIWGALDMCGGMFIRLFCGHLFCLCVLVCARARECDLSFMRVLCCLSVPAQVPGLFARLGLYACLDRFGLCAHSFGPVCAS